MIVAYIAGPFRGPTPWDVEQNVRRAEEVALALWRAGIAALCPHTNTRHFDKAAPDTNFLEGTLELLRRCDVVFMLPGWRASSGARAERKEAERLQIPIHEWPDVELGYIAVQRQPPAASELRRQLTEWEDVLAPYWDRTKPEPSAPRQVLQVIEDLKRRGST